MTKIKSFFKIISGKVFLKQYGFAALLLVAFFSIVFLWLRYSTNHGEEFSVPNFTGLTVEQAMKKGNEHNLRIEVIDSVYSGIGKRGTIIDQNPPPDFKVKSNRKIFITIKSVNPRIIKMPDFIHTTLIQAKADIETYGLRIGKISYEPSIYDNVVLEQKYKNMPIIPGTDIPQGAEIELVLGKSVDMGRAVTPDLIGLELEEAELEAAAFMLNLGVILYDNTVRNYNDSLNAKILSQRPVPNVSVQPGDEIDVVLSLKSDTNNN